MYKEFSSYGESYKALQSAQKRNDLPPLYTLYINRKLGRFLAVLSHRINLTPDQVTLIGFSLTLIGLVYIVTGGYNSISSSIIGVFLLLFAFALDSADGQLARLTGMKSPAGEWLDHTIDSIKIPLFHLSVFLVIYQTNPNISISEILFFLLISAFASAKFFASEIKDKLLASLDETNPGGGLSRAILLSLFDYGLLCFLFILSPFDVIYEVYFIWGFIFILFFLVSMVRSYLKLKAI